MLCIFLTIIFNCSFLVLYFLLDGLLVLLVHVISLLDQQVVLLPSSKVKTFLDLSKVLLFEISAFFTLVCFLLFILHSLLENVVAIFSVKLIKIYSWNLVDREYNFDPELISNSGIWIHQLGRPSSVSLLSKDVVYAWTKLACSIVLGIWISIMILRSRTSPIWVGSCHRCHNGLQRRLPLSHSWSCSVLDRTHDWRVVSCCIGLNSWIANSMPIANISQEPFVSPKFRIGRRYPIEFSLLWHVIEEELASCKLKEAHSHIKLDPILLGNSCFTCHYNLLQDKYNWLFCCWRSQSDLIIVCFNHASAISEWLLAIKIIDRHGG